MLTYAVTVSIDGLGEFGEFGVDDIMHFICGSLAAAYLCSRALLSNECTLKICSCDRSVFTDAFLTCDDEDSLIHG